MPLHRLFAIFSKDSEDRLQRWWSLKIRQWNTRTVWSLRNPSLRILWIVISISFALFHFVQCDGIFSFICNFTHQPGHNQIPEKTVWSSAIAYSNVSLREIMHFWATRVSHLSWVYPFRNTSCIGFSNTSGFSVSSRYLSEWCINGFFFQNNKSLSLALESLTFHHRLRLHRPSVSCLQSSHGFFL